jgi:hypothetical protein
MMTQLRNSRSGRLAPVCCQIGALVISVLLLGCGKTPPTTGGTTPPGGTAQGGKAGDGMVPGENKPESAPQDSSKPTPCEAVATWVTAPSEFDAKTFPDFKTVTNCDFHKWSYQSFLWLMSPDANGRLVFENFADPTDLFTSDGQGPGDVPYPGHKDSSRPLKMLARLAKSQTTVSIKDVFQAGPGNKALIDQNGRIVYYSNHLNKYYWDFIVAHQFWDLEKLQADKTTDFAVGSIELKASWRVAREQKDGEWGDWLIENAEERFYVIETAIPPVTTNSEGQIVTVDVAPVTAKMALVGMHVVGVVEHNPEFIWATFEHVDNAPTKANTPTNENGPTGPWSFYKPGTPLAQTNQFDVNNPLGVVNVCLVYPQGGGSETNTTNVMTINKSVQKLLKENAATLPKWAPNYYFGGAVWTNGGIPLNNGAFSQAQLDAYKNDPPNPDDPVLSQKGSLNLANTTLETFTQNDNCFACHNAGAHTFSVGDKATLINAKHINLSHFVVNYQATQQVKAPKND